MQYTKHSGIILTALGITLLPCTSAWATDRTTSGTPAIWAGDNGLEEATVDDDVIIAAGHTVSILNNGTADDDSANTNTFQLGNVTNTAGTGSISVTTGSSNDLTVTIGSANVASDVTIANNDTHANATTATITNNLTVGGNLAVTNNETVTASKDVDLSVNGNFNVTGTTTITGGDAVDAGAVLTLSGNTVAGSIVLADGVGANGQVVLNGSAQTVSSTINGNTDFEGDIDITGEDVTLNGAIGGSSALGNINITGVATVNTSTLVGDLNLEGTLTINVAVDGGAATSWDLGAESGAIIKMGTSSYSGSPMLELGSVTTIDASNTISLDTHPNFTSGTITVISGNGDTGTAGDTAQWTVSDNALATYVVTEPINGDIAVTATARTDAAIASQLSTTTSQAAAFKNAISSADAGSDTAITDEFNTVLAAGNSTTSDAANAVTVDLAGGVHRTATAAHKIIHKNTATRLAFLRQDTTDDTVVMTGFITGDSDPNSKAGMWIKPYASFGEQHKVETVDGYSSTAYGTTFGYDKQFGKDTTIGVNVGFSNTNVDGDGTTAKSAKSDSANVGLYGDYTFDDYFVQGMLSYAHSKVETTRNITVGSVNRKATGDFDAMQLFAQLDFGRDFHFGKAGRFTPTIGFDFSHYNGDTYTETGASSLNLVVDQKDVNMGYLTAGAEIANTWAMSNDDTLSPSMRIGGGYDLIDDTGVAVLSYTGGGSSFTADRPDVSQAVGYAGAGIAYTNAKENLDISLEYDLEIREQFQGHTGRLEFKYNF